MKPRTIQKHNNVLQEKSITQKKTRQNPTHIRIGNTNKSTHTKISLRKQMLEQKMSHMPQHSNKTPIPKHHLGTTRTTKCYYKCRSTTIVYLVTCKRCHKQYLGQTLSSLHTQLKENKSRRETQHIRQINIPHLEQPTHNQRHTN